MKKLFTTLLGLAAGISSMAQWNTNTSVNLELAAVQSSDLQALSTTDGKTWIAFYSQDGAGYQMRAQLLDSAGDKLLGPDGIVVDSFSSGSATYVFNICIDHKDNLVVTAQDERSGTGLQAVAYNIDQNGTSLWNGVDGIVLGGGLSPYPAVLSNGEVIVAWSDDNNKISMQKITTTGTTAWSSPVVFSLSSGHPSRGQIVPMSDSGYVMVYQKGSFGINSTLFAQRFDNDGVSVWTAPVQLCNEATSLARYYSITQDADTTYFGYYSSSLSNHFNSWLQRINPDGTLPYGINGAAFSDYSGGSDPLEQTTNIALDPGSPYVWAVSSFSDATQAEYGVYVQKFNKSDGSRLFNVNGKEVYPIGLDRYAQKGALALKDDQPVFMVCSDVNYLIKGTALDGNGDFLLPSQDVELSSTLIPQPSALYKNRFAFTQNVNGQSVAVWTENRGTEYRAYAQNFDLGVYDTSVTVTTENDVAAEINTMGGTLQMEAAIHPATASQDVTWSIVPGTGTATISATGMVTAATNGTVWAKAVSMAAPAFADSMEITISNQENGITEMASKIGLSIYPNPVQDVLNVTISKTHPALTLSLSDVRGNIIRTRPVAAQSLGTNVTMKMSGLAPGIYLLKITGEGIALSRKITKK